MNNLLIFLSLIIKLPGGLSKDASQARTTLVELVEHRVMLEHQV